MTFLNFSCASPRSLNANQLCGIGIDMSGNGTYSPGEYTTEGINALCEALKSATTLTSLKYTSQLESFPTVNI